jgi:hypothetical protein
MKIFIALFMSLIFCLNLFSQISYSQFNPFVYNEYKMVNRNHHLNLGYQYYGFSIEGSLTKKLKIITTTSEYNGETYFDFRHELYDPKTKTGAKAYILNLTKIKRSDYLLKYEIRSFFNFLTFHGIGGIAFQNSTILRGDGTLYLGPELKDTPYQQTKPLRLEKFAISQWVPMIGAEVAVKIWKFELFANWIGVKGFKAHQTWSFDYNYNGVPQPTAVAEMRGTGVFQSYGIRANFLGPKYEDKK